jgi:hypothetical protein
MKMVIFVIPAQAGIQTEDFHINSLDSRFRGNDGRGNDGILLFGESLCQMNNTNPLPQKRLQWKIVGNTFSLRPENFGILH